MIDDLIIRPEKDDDSYDIRRVHGTAFPTPAESKLVDVLRDNNKNIISLIAEYNNQIIGHILFTRVNIYPQVENINGLGLAPLAVTPEYQNCGIGSALIHAGIDKANELNYDFIVVLGFAQYYSRFGFEQASLFGIENQYEADEHFLIMELRDGALIDIEGTAVYQSEFEQFGC